VLFTNERYDGLPLACQNDSLQGVYSLRYRALKDPQLSEIPQYTGVLTYAFFTVTGHVGMMEALDVRMRGESSTSDPTETERWKIP
jgi:hypothetical protein